MLVREATHSDSSKITEYQLAMAWESEKLKLDPNIVRNGVEAVFLNSNYGFYLVAESNNNVIGCLLVVPEWSDWRNAQIWWIHSVYVAPDSRNRGVYKEMYSYLQKRVENSSKLCGLRLYVDKENRTAQKVYKKLKMNNDHYLLYEWLKNT